MNPSAVALDPHPVAIEMVGRLEQAWNDADGQAFGQPFAPDASFVTVRGEHILGSDAIGTGHDGIFHSIYAGSVNQMEVVRTAQVSDSVIVATSRNTLDCPGGPLAGRHQALSTIVIARTADDQWQIVASHNTLVAG